MNCNLNLFVHTSLLLMLEKSEENFRGLRLNMEGTSKLRFFLFKSYFYSGRLNYIPVKLISGFVVLDFGYFMSY